LSSHIGHGGLRPAVVDNFGQERQHSYCLDVAQEGYKLGSYILPLKSYYDCKFATLYIVFSDLSVIMKPVSFDLTIASALKLFLENLDYLSWSNNISKIVSPAFC